MLWIVAKCDAFVRSIAICVKTSQSVTDRRKNVLEWYGGPQRATRYDMI